MILLLLCFYYGLVISESLGSGGSVVSGGVVGSVVSGGVVVSVESEGSVVVSGCFNVYVAALPCNPL